MAMNSWYQLRIRRLAQIAVCLTFLAVANAPQLFAQCRCCNSGDCSSSCGQCNCLSHGGCGGCVAESLCTREHLFGDWLGARSGLAQHGILADLYLTQFYQGVTNGGVDQTFKYGGKLHYEFTFEGEKLGLNKGLAVVMHAETRFGEDVNAQAGALAFPNTDMLFPFPERQLTAIPGLFVTQALNERFTLTVGKYRTLDLFNMIYPDAHVRGVDGFMNINFLLPLTLFRTTDLALNGAGILAMRGEQIQSGVLVYDPKNVSTTVAPDLFGEGAVILGYHRFFTEFGSHGFLGNWSSRTYTATDPFSWTVIPGEGLAAGQKTGSWSLAYFLDQMLWADHCNEQRNLRLFSVWGLADTNPNPYRWTGNVSLQGSGLIGGREADTMGVGYFYVGLNSNFKQLASAGPLPNIQDLQRGHHPLVSSDSGLAGCR